MTAPQWNAHSLPTYVPHLIPEVRTDRPGMGVTGLVLGIVSLVFAPIPFVGVIAWILWPLGVIFSAVGLQRCREGQARNRGVALSGLSTSLVSAGICFLWVLLTVGLSTPH